MKLVVEYNFSKYAENKIIFFYFHRPFIQKTRKNKYFRKGKLDWDSHSTDGKYVRDNCKPLIRYCRRKEEPEHLKFFDLIAQV